jgi:hypothetical protein
MHRARVDDVLALGRRAHVHLGNEREDLVGLPLNLRRETLAFGGELAGVTQRPEQ